MKPNYLISVLAALVGFSIAWIAKPTAPAPPDSAEIKKIDPKRPSRAEPKDRTSAADGKRPKEVHARDFPRADLAEQGPKSRHEAKMLRLTEALGLSLDQQGAIIKLVEETRLKLDPNLSVIEDLNQRGKLIEAGLAASLTPEQLAKFQELRVRERENRTELRAQKMLSSALEDIDISLEQREELLSRLREKSKSELQSIPSAATLLFDKSMLPTGKELSLDGVLSLVKMDAQVVTADPAQTHDNVINSHRRDLEEILKCFDGILTGGQMGQYQAILNEQLSYMKKMQERASELPPRNPAITPATPTPEAVPPDPEFEVPDEFEQDPD